MLNFFAKKVCALLTELATSSEARMKTKKIHSVLEFNQSQ